jgi:PKD domain/Carbohydrate binding domain
MTTLLVITSITGSILVATSLSGCKDDAEKLPKVVAGFTNTVNEDTGTVTFLNTSERATKYVWAFGDNTTSTEINPIKTYPAGTYFVSLTASNNAGGSNVFKDTLNIVIKDKVSLPITFDNTNVDYAVTTFNGAAFAIVSNPSPSGTNNKTTKVGSITNSGVAFEGMFLNVATQIDLATKKTISMNLRSTKAVSVLLKLEEGTSGAIEMVVAHGGTGWENLLFNFNSSAKYSRITLFVGGATATSGTFFVDDIEQKVTETPCTPEAAQGLTAADFNITFKTDPGTAIGSFNATYTFANNPDFKNVVNASCKVGKIERVGSDLFANNQITFTSKLDFTTHSGFKMKVFSATTGYNVLVKLEDKTNPNINTELSKTTTVGTNQWEELTFPFAGSQSGKYDKIILFFQLNTNTTATYYIDDFAFYGTGSGATSPTVAAPTPPARTASDVISIFSNAYTNITGVDYNPNWGQSTVTTTIQVAGNSTLKYAGLNYQGTDFTGNPQNVASMSFLHLDYWTANSTALNVYAISAGPVEKAKVLTVPTNGNWTSIDIPLSDFSPVALANIIQFKFDGNGDIFLDNLYFYRTGPPATSPTVAAPTPPARASGDVISIFSNAYTNISGVDYNPNWGQSTVTTTISVAGNSTLKYAGLDYQGTDFAGNAQNVSTMNFVHLDYWTANSTALNIYAISAGPSEKAKALTVPTNGNWTSIDIPLSNFAPPVNLANIIQFKFDGNGDIFLDNLYFYKTAGSGGTTNLAANGDFETGADSGWVRFQNGGTSVLDNTTPNNGAGSWSGKLATGGPSNPAFKQERIGAGTVKAGDVVRIKFDHKGAVVPPGGVFNVILFGEGASGASFTHVFNPAPSLGSGWTTFTGTFTIAGGTDVSQGISFLIEAVCGGDVGCSVTANIDNVSVVLNP